MPSRDAEKPDNIPDMTLPERSTPPASSAVPDLSLPTRIESRLPAKEPPPWEKAKSHNSGWKVGDRVLAPWEPVFLYVGTIQEFKAAKALIQFDDGDAGWVFIDQIEQVAVKCGQRVLSRRNMGATFHQAEILEYRGDKVLVGFDNGGENEWTTIAALRVIRDKEGDGAEPTKIEANRNYLDEIRIGDQVWAPWNVEALFVGVVKEIHGGEAHIHFADGDQGWVRLEQLLPCEIAVGLRVMGRWRMGNQYFPGTIDKVVEGRIRIQYDDGDQEWSSPAALALPREPVGPAARPTKNAWHFNSNARNWLIWIAVFGAITILRMGCR